MIQNPELRAGMFVLSIDGQKLGRIARIGDDGFDVVRGGRDARGFHASFDELCSQLKAEVFLLRRYRDYLPLYEPWTGPAPQPHVRVGGAGRRFHLFRRAEARW